MILCVAVVVSPTALAQEEEEEASDPVGTRVALPGGYEASFKSGRQEGENSILEGDVTIIAAQGRFQADRVVVQGRRYIEATGNVLIVWGKNRISGTRMAYDLEEDKGVIENAIGHVQPEFFFYAERVEKIGEDLLYLEKANITTCTQPVPYWSFAVGKATVRVNGYARMWHVRLRTKDKPIVYLPYMIWPVKEDRTLGLLFPSFGSTEERGTVIAQGLFIPMGQSADMTLVGEYYTRAGFGLGSEVRFVPNQKGLGIFNGFFIQDKVANVGKTVPVCAQEPCDRWRVTYRQTQEFQNGFRMVADINQASDFDYFTDFERDIRLLSTPEMLARVEFSRNGRFNSVNVRQLRREQLVTDPVTFLQDSLVQRALPEIEFRGRSRRLGKSFVYQSYQSSFAAVTQAGPTIDADYLRADLFPTISFPVSNLPWLDVNPSIAYRLTHWTQRNVSDDPLIADAVDDPLTRGNLGAALEIVGPRVFRIFGKQGGAQHKHVWEPLLRYGFRQDFEDADQVIRFDEVDLVAPQNLLTYGVRTRVFARRPRTRQQPRAVAGETVLMPDGEAFAPEAPDTGFPLREPPAPEPAPAAPTEPVEIMTVELTQSRSFDRDLSTGDIDGDGVFETDRRGPILLTGRYNPTRRLSFDLRTSYNVVFDSFSDVSVNGAVRQKNYRIGASVVYRPGLGALATRDTQVRFNSAFQAFRGKLRMELDGAFTANPTQGISHVPDRRVRLEYYTQCCGLLAEYLVREYTTSKRQDFRFTVDLRGIGKFLDVHHGLDR